MNTWQLSFFYWNNVNRFDLLLAFENKNKKQLIERHNYFLPKSRKSGIISKELSVWKKNNVDLSTKNPDAEAFLSPICQQAL